MSFQLLDLFAEDSGDGKYCLSWQPTREPDSLDLTIALRPDTQGQILGRVCSTQGRIEVDALSDVDRHYFELVSSRGDRHTIATRHIPLEGGKNFRDLGGYKTPLGQAIRWGKLYRSGHLSFLTDSDLNKITGLELAMVFDFRDDKEREKRPNRYPLVAPKEKSLPIEPGSMSTFLAKAASGNLSANYVVEFMESINRELVTDYQGQYREMFKELLSNDGSPIVMHCAAGKDRTGLGVALTLASLGISESVIMEDYLLSNEYVAIATDAARVAEEVAHKVGRQISSSALHPMFEVRESYLGSAMNTIKQQFGGIDSYLAQQIGLSDHDREQLQDYYLN